MATPYVPKRPVVAAELPTASVHLVMMEAWLEHQIRQAKPRKRARMIAGMYEVADDLEARQHHALSVNGSPGGEERSGAASPGRGHVPGARVLIHPSVS